jgi:hypothetical protein
MTKAGHLSNESLGRMNRILKRSGSGKPTILNRLDVSSHLELVLALSPIPFSNSSPLLVKQS